MKDYYDTSAYIYAPCTDKWIVMAEGECITDVYDSIADARDARDILLRKYAFEDMYLVNLYN